MKRFISKSISNFCAFRSRFLKDFDNAGLRLLNYHSIGGVAYQDTSGYFSITSCLFKAHIDYIFSEYPASILSLKNLLIPKDKLGIAITFDDGYLDNLRVAAPILLERNIPFMVFVSTNFVKNKTAGFLSPIDLKELSQLPGVTIGSHGKSHINLDIAPKSLQIEELRDSKFYLEDLIGQQVNSFAYPYGKFNKDLLFRVSEAGYETAFTTKFELNKHDVDRFQLARFNIESDNTLKILSQKINGDWDWYKWRGCLSKSYFFK